MSTPAYFLKKTIMARAYEYILRSALLGFAVLAAYVQIAYGFMGDKGWLIFAAGRWLSGDRLYSDLIEVNPPLIFWLYALPIKLSHFYKGFEDYAAVSLLGLLATAFSVALCLSVICRHPEFQGNRRRQIRFGMLLTMIFLCITNPVYFFDREHILLILTFPYLLRFMPPLASRPLPVGLRIIIGALAGIGFCIKPHAIIIFTALQFIFLIREKSAHILWSLENITLYLIALLYMTCVFYGAPEYVHNVLPMVLTAYSGYSNKTNARFYLPLVILSLVVPLLDFRKKDQTPFRPGVYYLLQSTAAYGAYTFANNGWGYTYLPLLSLLVFLSGWLAWDYGWLAQERAARGLPSRSFRQGLHACMFCLLANGLYGLFLMLATVSSGNCGGYTGCADNVPFVRFIAENHIRSFSVLAGDFNRWPQISRESGAQWKVRFNHLWMVPTLFKKNLVSDPSHAEVMRYVGNILGADIESRKPDAVFVDNSDLFMTTFYHIDLIKFFSAVPLFADAWRSYHYAASLNRCQSNPRYFSTAVEACRYDMYIRNGYVR